MREGFYRVDYQGIAGLGFAIMVLDTGDVIGADMMGGVYNGTYEWNDQTQLLDVTASGQVPEGVQLVQGVVAPAGGMELEIQCSFPREPDNVVVPAMTNHGPIQVAVRFLRGFS